MGRNMRFRGTKTTPKKLERELLANAKLLADRPELLVPEGDPKSRREFEKMLKRLDKVLRYRGDVDTLKLLASKGDQMSRAYAALLSLEAQGRIPHLASARLPTGEVSYAQRGKVDKEKLIALQHFDDPELRLLAYWETARKRNLHVYSLPDGLMVTGKDPQAPPAYIEERMASCGYAYKDGCCGHEGACMTVNWISADRQVRVCRDCAAHTNLVDHLARRIAARDHLDDFEVSVSHSFKVASGDPPAQVGLSKDLRQRYLRGGMDDRALIDAYLEEERESLRSGDRIYVIGDRSYGTDLDAFLSAMRGGEPEIRALRSVLADCDSPVVLEEARAGDAVMALWDDHEGDLLAAVASPEAVAEVRNLERDLSPGQMLVEANRLEVSRTVLATLPTYSRLGEVGSLADMWARIYKTEGPEATGRDIGRTTLRSHHLKAVAFAFLKASGQEASLSWQFTKEEEEFGNYLSGAAGRMLEGDGDSYDKALRDLVMGSGSLEEVVRD